MTILIFLLWVAALAYQVVALACLWRFFRPGAAPPQDPPRRGPGITVFKPVKGLEPATTDCLRSFLAQEYTPYQVLFGVADEDDPALPVLRELANRTDSPEVQVVVCPETRGLNPKVSILSHLAPLARYDLLVVADADVKVPPDFLARAAEALGQPGMGLVSCPYRGGEAQTLGSRLEGLSIAADFIPSVAVAHFLEGISFALGAAMALTRQALEASGGFAALADFLADDYQLGQRISQAGFGVALLPLVVETVNPAMSLKEYLLHQVRWSRTYRVCRPTGYLAYGITHAFPFAVALWWASGLAGGAGMLVALTFLLRLGLASYSARRCLQGVWSPTMLILLPVKDLLALGFWLLSFLGNTITWRGRRFRVAPSGRLIPLE